MTTPGDYWRLGDDPGSRRFVTLADPRGDGFWFDGGGHLSEVIVAYETWGTLNADRSNAVLIEHALTGDSHAVGDAGPGHPTSGWWNGLIGPGLGIDTNEWYVVCANVLGGSQGTTGPSSSDRDGRERKRTSHTGVGLFSAQAKRRSMKALVAASARAFFFHPARACA